MPIKNQKLFTFVFILILIAELITGNSTSLNAIHYYTKPALLILLLNFFWVNSRHLTSKTRNTMFLALFFSLLGDVLLLFVTNSHYFFIAGLFAFLLAHIFYIVVFLFKKNKDNNLLPFVFVILFIASGLYSIIRPGLATMQIPVSIYILVISIMAITAFLRKGKVNKESYYLVLIGAILFMLSDSILALNKFYRPLAFSHISIMLTYALAQLAIVFGILKQR